MFADLVSAVSTFLLDFAPTQNKHCSNKHPNYPRIQSFYPPKPTSVTSHRIYYRHGATPV